MGDLRFVNDSSRRRQIVAPRPHAVKRGAVRVIRPGSAAATRAPAPAYRTAQREGVMRKRLVVGLFALAAALRYSL